MEAEEFENDDRVEALYQNSERRWNEKDISRLLCDAPRCAGSLATADTNNSCYVFARPTFCSRYTR